MKQIKLPQTFSEVPPELIKSGIILLVICCVLIKPLRDISFENAFVKKSDTVCIEYLDRAMVRATVAWAACRVINRIVSVLQEMEFGIEIFVAVKVNPLEILDPVNDLIERCSGLLLISMASIGIQEFLIRVFPTSLLFFLLVPGLLIWLAGVWVSPVFRIDISRMGRQIVFLAVILRFIIPIEVAVNQSVYHYFLKDDYEKTIGYLERKAKEMQQQAPSGEILIPGSETEGTSRSKGGINKLLSKGSAAAGQAVSLARTLPEELSTLMKWLSTELKELFETLINMLLFFIITTIFLPVFTLCMSVYLVKVITRSRLRESG